jgi:hypothetical protein
MSDQIIDVALSNDLIIDTWPLKDNCAFYLDSCQINVRFRNRTSETLAINRIECSFECDEGMEPFKVVLSEATVTLQPGYQCRPIRVIFQVDLTLKPDSNFYRLRIFYFKSGEGKILDHDPKKYIRFDRLGTGEKRFFISHKDPEDSEACHKLSRFLDKLGYVGYLSEKDLKTGLDLWKVKIPNAIKNSHCLIVFWTSQAALAPGRVYEEISLAKLYHKKIILARENGLTLPEGISVEQEWYHNHELTQDSALKEFAVSIEGSDSELPIENMR